MKNTVLILVTILVALFTTNIQAQRIDGLASNKPLDIGFNFITRYTWYDGLRVFEVQGNGREGDLNVIYIGIPKSVKTSDLNNYIKMNKKSLSTWEMISRKGGNRNNIVYHGNVGRAESDKFNEMDVKILRLFNYKNTQNSLVFNTSEIFSGTAELETGEKCLIYHNINGDYMYQERYTILITVGKTQVKYEFY